MKTELELKKNVEDELTWEPSVDAAHIGVSVRNGVARLDGHVATFVEKMRAERAALRVKGVQAVANELEVRIADGEARDDESLAAACVSALAADGEVPRDRIDVVVRHGHVILRGRVRWAFQRDAAAAAVRNLRGIRSLSNDVFIERSPSPIDVQKRIEIPRFAEEIRADLVAMGTHGKTGLAHLLLGSVAERVVRTCSVPVLTVREPRPAGTAP